MSWPATGRNTPGSQRLLASLDAASQQLPVFERHVEFERLRAVDQRDHRWAQLGSAAGLINPR